MPASIVPLHESEPKKYDVSDKKADSDLFQGLPVGFPVMPGSMSNTAKRHWVYIGEQLVKTGLLSQVDLGQFRILCETYALYVKAQAECLRLGEYQETPNGYEQLAPWAVARERHAARYQKLADKFFLSPRARTQIKIENPDQGTLDLD